MKKYGFIYSYLRVFLYYCLTFSAANILIYVSRQVFGRGTPMGASAIVLSSSIISLLVADRYSYAKKAISIDDRQLTIKRISDAMAKMKWNIEEDNENIKVFTPRYQLWFWKDRIRFYLTDMEIHISGPNEYVERVIQLSKFPYGVFDITERED